MAIGSVQRAKGHWLLLDALAYLPPDTRLVLVTGGASSEYATSTRGRVKRALRIPLDNLDALLRDAADRGLRDRILVTGYRSDIARVVAAADVLAFPSLLPEGFGRPIIEAMAAERPVVATDVGPSRELLGAGTGLLVPCDAQALASALASLLRDPRRRAEMGRIGRARVVECFSLERQVAEMTTIYHSVLGT
jgi:glycosyltransferase involved in cell wall biosynthesis